MAVAECGQRLPCARGNAQRPVALAGKTRARTRRRLLRRLLRRLRVRVVEAVAVERAVAVDALLRRARRWRWLIVVVVRRMQIAKKQKAKRPPQATMRAERLA